MHNKTKTEIWYETHRYAITRVLLLVAIISFGWAIYDPNGNTHKRLVILGFMLFGIFFLVREKGD